MLEYIPYWLQGVGAISLGAVVLWVAIRLNTVTNEFLHSQTNKVIISRHVSPAGPEPVVATTQVVVETEPIHPCYAVSEAILKKFRSSGSDYAMLDDHERNFMRAGEFDTRLLNGGLDNFFFAVPSEQAWKETEIALLAVGAHLWAEIFGNILRAEEATLRRYYLDSESYDDDNDFDPGIWEEWAAKLWEARDGSEFEDKITYMERLLDQYSIQYF